MAAMIKCLTGRSNTGGRRCRASKVRRFKTPTGCLSAGQQGAPIPLGITRSDVLVHMPRPPAAMFVSNAVVRNVRWFFEGNRLVCRNGEALKAVPPPLAEASAGV